MNSSQLTSTLLDHAKTLVESFNGSTTNIPASYCFDVVNEAISDNPLLNFKNNTWYSAIPDYVALCFTLPVKPIHQLNFFIMTMVVKLLVIIKVKKFYNMIKNLLERKVPIDGVGLQMHLIMGLIPKATDIAANIKRLVALGLEVHITEMDVACVPVLGIICNADQLQKQALIYGDILQACLDNRKVKRIYQVKGGCTSFETWGFTDRHTWLWNFNNPKHLNMQPLLYETNFQPKPSY
jgi:endo-1,4-beta-xylanase